MGAAPPCGIMLTTFAFRQWTGAGHDLSPVRAGRRQHPVVAHQVEARRWHQGGEFLQQFLW